ncbi:hypothetical protein FB567DRAFT_331219 [Paraphoma chrysanthemicola]|uniref:Uncharacterized protein n=1 Tax=Paraphoma chrysanthemicola TaxID=798071 RepID=A0A8K0VYM2_9PLEO|nr:hypothetical protein FB567DRAFT_331219 [Paraphoma chrysanthemicola]
MSKRNSDGDVLANKLSLMQANSQRRLAAMLGPAPESYATTAAATQEDEDEDLKKEYADPEVLGIGGMRPKDIADGSFTRRTLTSSDKLLEQLIGKKKAKAHLAAQQNASRLGAKPQPFKHDRSHAKKEESEDEEEGRTAAFKSKRRRTAKVKVEPADLEDEEQRGAVISSNGEKLPDGEGEAQQADSNQQEDDEEDVTPPMRAPKSIPSRSKPKATSYLDEILAERSKKKKKKNNPTA